MFKIGIITDQVSMDFEEALQIIKEFGVRYIEIHSLWNKTIEELTEEEANQAQKLVKKFGFTVSNISSTLFLMCPLQEHKKELKIFDEHFITKIGNYEEHLKALEYCIELCRLFGTDKIRIFGFRKEEDLDKDTAIKLIVEKLRQPVELAEKRKITLILENCPHTYLETGSLTKQVIQKINSKSLKALWDPGNAFRSGKAPYPDDYNNIKSYISHIHLKDFVITDSIYQPVAIGKGNINYRDIIRNLIVDNYEGVISLEPEYKDETGGGAESTKQCLTGMKQIINSLNIEI